MLIAGIAGGTGSEPSHLQFIEPSKRYAGIIIPGGGENSTGIEFLVSIIERHLLRV